MTGIRSDHPDIRQHYRGFVIAVCGPPHSGKSVFISALYRQLLSRFPTGTFLERACPDGEGMWSAESESEVAQRLRKKHPFTEAFTTQKAEALRNLGLGQPRVLVDLGGRMEPPNDQFLELCTNAIIVSRDEAGIAMWREYARGFGCEPIVEVVSRLVKTDDGLLDVSGSTPDQPWDGPAPLRGEIWQLDRSGPAALFQGSVEKIADWLCAAPLREGP